MATSSRATVSLRRDYLFAYDIGTGKVNIIEKKEPKKTLTALIYGRVSGHAQVVDGS